MSKNFQVSGRLEANEPLWKRVPSSDANGRALTDFMMLIPRLKTWPGHRVDSVLTTIQAVFDEFGDQVVFADLNVQLNLLWVSVRPSPGICMALPAAVKAKVPEAVLVASQFEAMVGEARRQTRPRRRWGLLLGRK